MKILPTVSLLSALPLLACFSVQGRPVSNVRVALTICLTNEAGVSTKVVKEVEARVTSLFKESAIELRWVTSGSLAPAYCGPVSYPDRLMVHWIPKARIAAADVLGEAFLDEQNAGVVADLFLDHVRTVELDTKVGFATLLAYATAHEVGHLLLGANSHSPRGIMQGHFHTQNLLAMRHCALTFEHTEEVRMHSRLLRDPLPYSPASGR